MDARQYLQTIGTTVQDVFIRNRMLLSFQEWLDGFYKEPRRYSRSAAQYLRDVDVKSTSFHFEKFAASIS